MIALIQRVSDANVTVDGELVAEIGSGLVVLIGVERGDTPAQAERLAERILTYRMFADSTERMNLSVREAEGDVLLVPQFTLAADTNSGNRPSFTPAAEPEVGRLLFDRLVEAAKSAWPRVVTGRFGATMAVQLTNAGPVTFWLRVAPPVHAQQQ